MMKIPIGDQASGVDTASFTVGAQRVRPLICYEDLFGEDFATSMVGPEAATLMANSTNLAWFGKRMILDQHLQFSRMRASGFQRGRVRATNTGAAAVIDWQGHVHRPPAARGGGAKLGCSTVERGASATRRRTELWVARRSL